MTETIFHYPPELFQLLTDGIAVLCRSKTDVLLFFQGAGVPARLLADWEAQLVTDRDSVRKHEIVRSVLRDLNDAGDAMLRPRREIVRRVSEFEDFSGCWPGDELKARALVTQVRHVVNVKDSFTRMKEEREREQRAHRAAREAEIAALDAVQKERAAIKTDLCGLFQELNPWKRGKALEDVLGRLFRSYGILVREAFTLKGDEGQGIVEQIDGVIELDGEIYLVEMKWLDTPLGPGDAAQHLTRVFFRAEARGLLISSSRFTAATIESHRTALAHKVCLLCELDEIVMLLEQDKDLKELLRRKRQFALTERRPLVRCLGEI